MTKQFIYVGIGPVAAPTSIKLGAFNCGQTLAEMGWHLRSGGDDNGMDGSFERGCDAGKGTKEIYLHDKLRPNMGNCHLVHTLPDHLEAMRQVIDVVGEEKFKGMGQTVQMFMVRNVFALMGSNLKKPVPADCVITWNNYPEWTTGAGTLKLLAQGAGIPVFDLNEEGAQERLEEFVGSLS